MGTTFVGLDDPRRGFWISDTILELWLRFLALHVEDPVESGSLGTRIRDRWLLASRGYFSGCVPEGLAETVSIPEGDRLVRGAIGSLMGAFRSAPPHLSSGVLNLMGFAGGEFTADIETWRLVEVGEAYLGMLDGKVEAGPSDALFMPGCRAAKARRTSRRTRPGPHVGFARFVVPRCGPVSGVVAVRRRTRPSDPFPCESPPRRPAQGPRSRNWVQKARNFASGKRQKA